MMVRFALAVVGFIAILLGGVLAVIAAWSSPGTPRPYLDSLGVPLAGSISEKIFIEINGARQGIILKGRDASKPVLLYLHGGIPDYFLTEKFATGLDEDFVVAWWEQRGSGLSYSPNIPLETLSVEQLVADTIAVTHYLRQRFGQERIYLMGHSGGTFLGVQAVARAPELFHAYVGVAQMANQLTSERESYDYMLKKFQEQGNEKMVTALEAAPVGDQVPEDYYAVRDVAMHALGVGTTRSTTSVLAGIFFPSLRFGEYTLREKWNLWRGKAATGVSSMWREMLQTDLAERVPKVAVPTYFFHGVYDYTCTLSEAERYFHKLEAPLKGFYYFAESAHSPIFEEPSKVRRILQQDILPARNALADLR